MIIGLGLTLREMLLGSIAGGAFTPASLFASGEEGAWYEPSPTTAFTDASGTVAATYGDAVQYLEDLSGNGNHATQTTLASRPILARVPEGGRRNLLTYSEQFDNDAWVLDNSGATNPVVTANAATAPDGTLTADRIQLDKTGGGYCRIQQLKTGLPSAIYTFSVWLRNNAVGTSNVGIRIFDTGANCAVTESWQLFSVSLTVARTAADAQIMLFDSIVGNDETADILAWGAQVELGSTATAYQKVVDEYDITEAGVTSLDYLFDDQSDDVMPWTAPSDTDYTIAYVNTDGTVTTLTSQSLSGSTDILLDPAIVAYIAVDRSLSAGELSDLETYLGALA